MYLYNTGKCDLFIKTKYTGLDRAHRLGHHEIVEYNYSYSSTVIHHIKLYI